MLVSILAGERRIIICLLFVRIHDRAVGALHALPFGLGAPYPDDVLAGVHGGAVLGDKHASTFERGTVGFGDPADDVSGGHGCQHGAVLRPAWGLEPRGQTSRATVVRRTVVSGEAVGLAVCPQLGSLGEQSAGEMQSRKGEGEHAKAMEGGHRRLLGLEVKWLSSLDTKPRRHREV